MNGWLLDDEAMIYVRLSSMMESSSRRWLKFATRRNRHTCHSEEGMNRPRRQIAWGRHPPDMMVVKYKDFSERKYD